MAKEKDPNEIKVNDRRLFTLDGDLRDDAPAEPPAAHVAEESAAKERPSLELVKDGKPEPSAAGESEEPKLGPVAVPDDAAEAHMKSEAQKAYNSTDVNRPAFGGQEPGFLHLLELLVQSAMMYAGAMEEGTERRIDVVGLRQMIDLIGVLEEKRAATSRHKRRRQSRTHSSNSA